VLSFLISVVEQWKGKLCVHTARVRLRLTFIRTKAKKRKMRTKDAERFIHS